MIKNILVLLLLVTVIDSTAQAKRDFYLIKVYQLANAEQVATTETFLEKAWLPAVHRYGISTVGIFKLVGNDTAKTKNIYVLIPLSSTDEAYRLDDQLEKDKEYLSAGKAYIDAPHDKPNYQRLETILLRAFADMPHFAKPLLSGDKKDHVYELRSYESATEKIYRKKVEMFNKGGEIILFDRLKFNAIFYGEVLAGSKMPNLMYMTSFNNMEARNEHWKNFVDDPVWKKLVAMPEYQNTVSKIDIIFLRPVSYSDL